MSVELALHHSCGLTLGRASGHHRMLPSIGEIRGSSDRVGDIVGDGDILTRQAKQQVAGVLADGLAG